MLLNDVYNALKTLDPEYPADIKDAIHNLSQLLLTRDYPDKYFGEVIGYGSYKEVYQLTPHTVIKFCSIDNPTELEEELYARAVSEKFGHFFVPTYFFELPFAIPAAALDTEDYNDDIIITNIEIQYVAETVYDLNLRFRDRYNQTSIVAGRAILTYSLIKRSRINFDKWLKDAMLYYSYDKLVDFINDFIEYYDMTDLHSENIGYINGNQPVILDWMSSI